MSGATGWSPYGAAARFYDLLSGEPVYRAGRVAGVEMLAPRAGDVVVDLGCGTGLNLALLVAAVGPAGRVIGVDRSEDMLRVARRRVVRHGWGTVDLVRADATTLVAERLPTDHVDAVLATYALSVVDDPAAAWDRVRTDVPRGARGLRVCVVDMQRPTGAAAVLAPLARLACALGGSDIEARPWSLLQRDGVDICARSLRGGHVQVVVGTLA